MGGISVSKCPDHHSSPGEAGGTKVDYTVSIGMLCRHFIHTTTVRWGGGNPPDQNHYTHKHYLPCTLKFLRDFIFINFINETAFTKLKSKYVDSSVQRIQQTRAIHGYKTHKLPSKQPICKIFLP